MAGGGNRRPSGSRRVVVTPLMAAECLTSGERPVADGALVGSTASLQSRRGGGVVVGIRLEVFPVTGFVATECLVSREFLVA